MILSIENGNFVKFELKIDTCTLYFLIGNVGYSKDVFTDKFHDFNLNDLDFSMNNIGKNSFYYESWLGYSNLRYNYHNDIIEEHVEYANNEHMLIEKS